MRMENILSSSLERRIVWMKFSATKTLSCNGGRQSGGPRCQGSGRRLPAPLCVLCGDRPATHEPAPDVCCAISIREPLGKERKCLENLHYFCGGGSVNKCVYECMQLDLNRQWTN